MKTRVVNIKDEEYDVYIGREGKGQSGYFGNPYKDHSRIKSIQLFEKYARDRINSDPEFKQQIKQLQGKRLGCFCKPKACHGDILVKLSEQLNMEDAVFDNYKGDKHEKKAP